MHLKDFKALTFDCYGTLIDWETGMINGLKDLVAKSGLKLSRNEILEAHGRHEAEQELQTPHRIYSEILTIVYKRLAEQWGVRTTLDACEAYGRSVADWPVFPDTPGALTYLKQHFKLIILSNIDNRSFTYSEAKMGVEFDAIYTAQDIGAYKPADANFNYLIGHIGDLGLERSEILHTAESLFHDHEPANRFNIASAWIHRRHADEGYGATRPPHNMPTTDFRFTSMGEMAAAHKSEITTA